MMPVLNGELFLPYSLQSLLAKNYSNFKLIILEVAPVVWAECSVP